MKIKINFLILCLGFCLNLKAQQNFFRGNNNYLAPLSPATVVTNGLVLNLEAGNTASYPGTGTVWTDLSGSANHGTLLNGVTFNSSNGGYFNFNGSSQYVSLNPSKLPVGTSDRTIIAFVKTPSSFIFLNHIIHWGSTSNNQTFGLALSNGQLNSHTWATYPGQGATVATSTNYFFAVTYTHASTLHKFWINGVSQGAGVSASINTGTADARIAHRVTGEEVWGPNGQIYQILVYNRALSDSEIQQNFNANKAKYGL